jgi:hypothetical protein
LRHLERKGAVAEQGLDRRGDAQEQRVFPAAALGAEQPAVAGVSPGRAQEDRDQRQGNQTGLHAQDQEDPANRLGGEDHIGQRRRQADGFEEHGRARQGENEGLQPQTVRQEHHAEGDAKHEGGIGCGSGVDHGVLQI